MRRTSHASARQPAAGRHVGERGARGRRHRPALEDGDATLLQPLAHVARGAAASEIEERLIARVTEAGEQAGAWVARIIATLGLGRADGKGDGAVPEALNELGGQLHASKPAAND